MPLTIISLKKVPNSLRGDLSKWMQEISTGVYVGNFNKRIREKLWERVRESIKDGEAIMCYSYRNEIGYSFETINSDREVIDYEGVPLVIFPKENSKINQTYISKSGFSDAAKFRKVQKYQKLVNKKINKDFIVIDIETDGLDYKKNSIIEIGAIKQINNEVYDFSELIKYNKKLPNTIIKLTGITNKEITSKGKKLKSVLEEFLLFIGDLDLVGYNINFDIKFLNNSLKDLGLPLIRNKKYDLMKYVKIENKYLDSYKLQDTLLHYGIDKKLPHRALSDAKLTYELSHEVNVFRKILDKD